MADLFWEQKDWESEDKHLSQLKKMPFQRQFPEVKLSEGVFVIRGPRQVGKTSFIKSLLSRETKAKRKCHYISCETVSTFQELHEILLSLKNVEIIFLDEVSFIPEWSRAIKHLIDSGSRQTFVITGSNAHDLKLGIDLMPGRWGAGGELQILPMLFDEFSKMRKLADYKKLDRVKELELYFRVGGFPLALAESGNSAKVPHKAMTTYLKWLQGDIIKLGKIENYMKELMGQIAKTTTSTVSLQTLASKTQMGSHHTAQEYISILESCFAVRTLFAIDPNEENYRFRKEKKFYFTDPLIFWIAHEWSGYKVDPEKASEKLAETVANEFLARKYKRFGYLSSRSGEVDFLLPKEWAIEAKWSEVATNLSKAYLKLSIPNKKVWTKNNFLE